MMKWISVPMATVFATLLAGAPARAQSAAKDKNPVPMSDVHIVMYQVLAELTALQPYVVSEKKFLDPKNESEIVSRLERLEKSFGEVIRKKELHSPTFRLTGEALENHFRNAKQLYKAGRKEYSRWMLEAVPTACASCHTQLPEAPKPLWGSGENDFKGSTFERAEFFFGSRNYDPALKLYDKVVADYPGNALPSESGIESREIETALARKLLIFIRSKRDPAAGAASFERDLSNKNLPKSVRTYLPEWIKQLKKAATERPFDFQKAGAVDTLRYAKRWFNKDSPRAWIAPEHPKLVGHLQAMAALYGYLDTHETDAATPEILYWLSIGERAFSRNFFFPFGNMYLLECIKRYSASAIAPKCYDEYADELAFMYSGSRGTDLPPEVVQTLKILKSTITNKGALKTVN